MSYITVAQKIILPRKIELFFELYWSASIVTYYHNKKGNRGMGPCVHMHMRDTTFHLKMKEKQVCYYRFVLNRCMHNDSLNVICCFSNKLKLTGKLCEGGVLHGKNR